MVRCRTSGSIGPDGLRPKAAGGACGTAELQPQTADLLQQALDCAARTGGAFDPTVYPLVCLWGFPSGEYHIPTEAELTGALAHTGAQHLQLDGAAAALDAGCSVDLGGIAKGYAAEQCAHQLEETGAQAAMLSLGGNVQTLGLKPDGSKWTVAIQDPNNTSSYVGVINVGETAVITSGSYQRNFTDTHGKFYHHILKPSTGYPVTNSLVSVTIICTDGVMADCLSTAMFVLGETAALNYWRTYGGFEMVLITSDNRIICTSGLLEEFTLSNSNYTLSYSE